MSGRENSATVAEVAERKRGRGKSVRWNVSHVDAPELRDALQRVVDEPQRHLRPHRVHEHCHHVQLAVTLKHVSVVVVVSKQW